MSLIARSLYRCKKCLNLQPKSYISSRFASQTANSTEDSQSTEKDQDAKWGRRYISGLQPTGALHVGNYFAVVKPCVKLQEKKEDLMVFIADMHTLTTQQDGQLLSDNVLEAATILLAAGLDPEQTTLWVQSAVPRHAELCWLLTCLATQARLHHLPQYKERVAAGGADITAGSLLYPVLQAADILLYRARLVPAGADQLQHVQLSALLARTANHRLGAHLFPAPVAVLPEDGSDRIRSLRDPTKKMSKSEPNEKSRILLTDSDEQIHLKIRKAVTDFTPQVTYSPDARPGVSNLVRLHCLAADMLPEEAVAECDHLTTADYKKVVAAALCEELAPVRERAAQLRARPAFVREVLRDGAARARRIADDTWEEVASAAGLDVAKPDLVRELRTRI
ncbi:tryptophan--tRNA ligase, mitochondrial [Plutella xylostella]|uniref:tryptophan--tRNA ligase, mitochondrial n=1 Tax=Plutella xylostella TaxID=51655 RepID=UPI0020329834|nr:tryptophan--tRNA ligase, mitochondrial [Plutella xylostella]